MEQPFNIKVSKNQIVGVFHAAQNRNGSNPVVIICHGFAGDKIGPWPYLFVFTARLLAQIGIAVIRFDFRGSGDSEGKFEDQNLESQLEDLRAVIEYAKTINSIDINRIGLIGHSRGGAVAIIETSSNPEIKTLVTWAAPANWDDIWGDLADRILTGERSMFSNLNQTKKLVETDKQYNPLTKFAEKTAVPWLIIHGDQDGSEVGEVPYDHAHRLHRAAPLSRLVTIKGAGHYFFEETARQQLWEATSDWLKEKLTS